MISKKKEGMTGWFDLYPPNEKIEFPWSDHYRRWGKRTRTGAWLILEWRGELAWDDGMDDDEGFGQDLNSNDAYGARVLYVDFHYLLREQLNEVLRKQGVTLRGPTWSLRKCPDGQCLLSCDGVLLIPELVSLIASSDACEGLALFGSGDNPINVRRAARRCIKRCLQDPSYLAHLRINKMRAEEVTDPKEYLPRDLVAFLTAKHPTLRPEKT